MQAAAVDLLVHQEEIVNRDIRRQRIFRERENPLDLPDVDFYSRFRMTKQKFFDLHNLLEQRLTHPTRRNKALPSTLQLLAALRFLASGSFEEVVGDTVKVHKSTISRCIVSRESYNSVILSN